jgi:lipid-A-disaccharide synthase
MNFRDTHYREEKRGDPLFFISAGDPSGDIYGSTLVRELKRLYPGSFFVGLGGKRMEAEGVHLLAAPERIATVGFTEVVKDIPFFYGLLRESESIFRHLSPELVILIDFPGFNLHLARKAKRRGLRTFFYISPQIWAWREGRFRDLVHNSDEIAVILPFEVELFKKWGREVHYFGHPMIGELASREPRESFMLRYGIDGGRPILGLSPGSRKREIAYHLPVFMKVAEKIQREIPDIQVLINRAPTISESELREKYLDGYEDYIIINDCHHTSIDISTLLLTKSGTSTLEAALLHTPMLVCYRMSQLSYMIARFLVNIPHISLVNILADKEIVPEYIQGEFNLERIFPAAMILLEDESKREEMIRDLREVSCSLEGGNTNQRVAGLVVSMIENGGKV